ncbi:HAMP domain-containing protein, partial [Salmonella enterica]|uniref:HAMP domain-containing protein n=1 Tax=Salmonella enterica TaxID=28901 RepID=UPI003CEABE1E
TGQEISSAIRNGEAVELGVGAVVVLLAALLALLATRSITRPIAEAVTIAKTVAAGDLGSRIEVKRKDETGELLQALKEMNNSL